MTQTSNDSAASQLATMARQHNLTNQGLATLYGVPLSTMKKWTQGTREPGAVFYKLTNVLNMVAIMAPNIFEQLKGVDDAE